MTVHVVSQQKSTHMETIPLLLSMDFEPTHVRRMIHRAWFHIDNIDTNLGFIYISYDTEIHVFQSVRLEIGGFQFTNEGGGDSLNFRFGMNFKIVYLDSNF